MTAPAASALAAEQVMARAGKTFHQAARLLPGNVREKVVLLYAFCRAVDDIADDPNLPIEERAMALQHLLHALHSADVQTLAACGWSLGDNRQRLSTAAVLVRAALGDLHQEQPATEDDVLTYAFGVAGSVGLLMADVLQADSRGVNAAIALGCAMQLSNICRDVAEDCRSGRAYLPATVVSKAAIASALVGGDAQAMQRVRSATMRLLKRADALYEAAYNGMWSLPARVRWSILVAAMCYREIGVKVGIDIDRSWQVRTVVSRTRKLQLILLASVRLLHPRFWWPRPRGSWPPCLGEGVATRMRQLGVTP